MRYLIDFDSTLADTHKAAIEAVNKWFVKDYTEEHFTTWNTELILTEEEADYMWGHHVFLSYTFQMGVMPVKGAIEGVVKLINQGHELVIVTDRSDAIKKATLDWLRQQGLDDLPVVFTRSKHSKTSMGTARTKAQTAWSRRLTHVVEDAPHHSAFLAEKDYIQKVYLLDKAYNRHVEHPKIERIYSWEDVK